MLENPCALSHAAGEAQGTPLQEDSPLCPQDTFYSVVLARILSCSGKLRENSGENSGSHLKY
jgi:hypothetical protein